MSDKENSYYEALAFHFLNFFEDYQGILSDDDVNEAYINFEQDPQLAANFGKFLQEQIKRIDNLKSLDDVFLSIRDEMETIISDDKLVSMYNF